MRNFYLSVFGSVLILSSCGVTINYIGNSYAPTQNVDVYLSPSEIKKNYQVIGKGIVYHDDVGSAVSDENIQDKALKKAKQKGADAIIIDYLTSSPINVVAQRDTMLVKQRGDRGISILFLRYSQDK